MNRSIHTWPLDTFRHAFISPSPHKLTACSSDAFLSLQKLAEIPELLSLQEIGQWPWGLSNSDWSPAPIDSNNMCAHFTLIPVADSEYQFKVVGWDSNLVRTWDLDLQPCVQALKPDTAAFEIGDNVTYVSRTTEATIEAVIAAVSTPSHQRGCT